MSAPVRASPAIAPNRGSVIRLIGAVLAEQTDEWAEWRRYLGLEVLAGSRMRFVALSAHTKDPPLHHYPGFDHGRQQDRY